MRIAYRAWLSLCTLAIAGLIGARLLRTLLVSPPASLDALLGSAMIAESELFLWPWVLSGPLWLELRSAAPFGAAGLAVAAAVLLLLLRRRLVRREGPRWRLAPAAVALAAAALLWLQFLLDASLFVAALCASSLLLLGLAHRLAQRLEPGRAALVAGGALFAVATVLLARDGAERAVALAWSLVALPGAVVLTRVLRARDVGLLLVLAAVPANLLPALLPLVLPLHGGARLGDGLAYGFCEDPERGVLYASVPACSSVNYVTERHPSRCPAGRVVAYDRETLAERARYAFFDADFNGRLEQLVCADGEVYAAVQGTRQGGESYVHTVLSFPADAPGAFTPIVAGPGIGSAIAYDARRDALFYVSEFSHRIVRHDRRSGALRELANPALAHTWVHPLDRLEYTGSWSRMSVDPEADRLYVAEWFHGRRAYALDLATLDVEARYVVNGGGAWGVTVDPGENRLLVAGVFGLAVVDLASGEVVARRRLGLGTKEPVLDAARDRLYVASVVEGKLRVLDRHTLDLIEQIPIGFGTRHPYLSLDGERLFASSLAAHYAFDPDALGRADP